MNPEEILELVKDGELDPAEIEDFQELNESFQEAVAEGDLDIDEATEQQKDGLDEPIS